METLNQALRGVQENLTALAIYLVVTVGVSTAKSALELVTNFPKDNPFGGPAVMLFHLGEMAAIVVAYSLAQSIAFARIGKHMDRPLYRIEGDVEAVRRYFAMWVILNAAALLPNEISLWVRTVQDDERTAGMMLPLIILLSVAAVPIGGALMFGGGKVRWREIGDRLAPLWRQIPKTLAVLLFGGIVLIFVSVLGQQAESQRFLKPLVDIVSGYCDCLMFAAAWYICMYDRANPEDDFEF